MPCNLYCKPLSLVKHDRSKQALPSLPPRPRPKLPDFAAKPTPPNPSGRVKLTVENVLKHNPQYQENPQPKESAASKKAKQRNYKNMTRERRVEANARERQRVHTITAAFDSLQAAIPTGGGTGDQAVDANKLSKLSIIKIATSYIMALSREAGYDYSMDQSAPSVEECVRNCQELIEAETKGAKGGGKQQH